METLVLSKMVNNDKHWLEKIMINGITVFILGLLTKNIALKFLGINDKEQEIGRVSCFSMPTEKRTYRNLTGFQGKIDRKPPKIDWSKKKMCPVVDVSYDFRWNLPIMTYEDSRWLWSDRQIMGISLFESYFNNKNCI